MRLRQSVVTFSEPPPRIDAERAVYPLSLSPETLAVLDGYSWPGNVRELKHTVEYVAATVTDEVEAR